MDLSVSILFALLWAIVGFVILRFILAGYFRETNRAIVASALTVAAFAVGASWPYSLRLAQPAPTSAPAVPVPAAVLPKATMSDVSSHCTRDIKVNEIRSAPGSLDSIGIPAAAKLVLHRGTMYEGTGWVEDPSKPVPAAAACLDVDGQILAGQHSYIGILRPDVATATKVPQMVDSGFRIRYPTGALSVGQHFIEAVALGSAGSNGVVYTRMNVTVTP